MDGQNRSQNKFQCSMTVGWYVVFDDNGNDAFWKYFTRPGMRHCWAYTQWQDGWISINTGRGFIRVNWSSQKDLEEQGFENMHHWCAANGKLVIPCRNEARDTWNPRVMPMTCVSIIKGLFGLRGCFSITPWQLYKYLVKNCLDVLEYKEISKYEVANEQSI